MTDESKAELVIMPTGSVRYEFDGKGGKVVIPAKPGHRIVVWSSSPLQYEYRPMNDGTVSGPYPANSGRKMPGAHGTDTP